MELQFVIQYIKKCILSSFIYYHKYHYVIVYMFTLLYPM